MNEEIIVAVYDTEAHAAAAVRDLEAAHVPQEAISRHAGTKSASGSAVSSANSDEGQGFWSSLFGGEPDHDTAVYDRSQLPVRERELVRFLIANVNGCPV